MAQLLDIQELAQAQKIPVEYMIGVAKDLVSEGKADRLLEGRTLVRFEKQEFDAVRNALSNDSRLASLSSSLKMNPALTRELVLRFSELNPSVPRQAIDRLVNSRAAAIEIVLEPRSENVSVDDVLEIQVKIKTDRELKDVQFSLEGSDGFLILEKPVSAKVIPQSDDPYLELVRLRAISAGNQRLSFSLKAYQDDTSVQKSESLSIDVHSKPPELEVSLLGIPDKAFFGKQFHIIVHLRNTGGGSAKEIKMTGLESLSPQLRVLQSLPERTEIPSQASLELPIILLPAKSGRAKAENVLLSYADLEGRSYSKPLGGIAIDVVLPQPDLKVTMTLPKAVSSGAETRVEYTINNYGEGDAKNIRMKTILVPTVTLIRGTLSRTVPVLRSQQFESGAFDVRMGTASEVVDHVELEFMDVEDAEKKVSLPPDALGPHEPVQVGALPIPVPQTVTQGAQVQQQILTLPAFQNIGPLVEYGTPEAWMEVLEGGKYSKVDFGDFFDNEDKYKEKGYRNLLIAIFDSRLDRKQLVPLLESDKFTFRAVEFLCALKEGRVVECDIASSDLQNADQLVKLLVGQAAQPAPNAPQVTKTKKPQKITLAKQFSFSDAKGKQIVIERQLQVNEDGRPEAVRYSISTAGEKEGSEVRSYSSQT